MWLCGCVWVCEMKELSILKENAIKPNLTYIAKKIVNTVLIK